MKKLLFTLTLLCSIVGLKAQSISHIETTKAWYYIYDQDGKKIKTLRECSASHLRNVRYWRRGCPITESCILTCVTFRSKGLTVSKDYSG